MERHRITRYVEPLREGGSLPGLVEVDDDGLYVVKFRGAGQGLRALVAEIIVGELARLIGLRVPTIALLELDSAIGRAEPDAEIQELLRASVGTNVGLDFLPASLPFAVHADRHIQPEEAARIVWLDFVATNVDRTPRNTNLLWWHGHVWLIDHGAALYRHHAAKLDASEADRPFSQIADHVLLPLLGATPERRLECLRAVHTELAPTITVESLAPVVDAVPFDWLEGSDYGAYLVERVAVVGRTLAEWTGLDSAGSASTGPGTGGLPRGPEAGRGLGPRVGAPKADGAAKPADDPHPEGGS